MKYKVGDKVRIKSIDWYNENKDEDGIVELSTHIFTPGMSQFCGKVVTIKDVFEDIDDNIVYYIEEIDYDWTDEMIDCLVERNKKTYPYTDLLLPYDNMIEGLSEEIEREHENKIFSEGYDQGYEDGQHDMNEWVLPEGFQFKDENGNVINATKIILDKKNDKKEKFLRELSDLLNKYNIDSKMDMPDYVLAEYIWRTLFVNE